MRARQIMSAEEMRRALVRVSHEIVEKHGGAQGLALIGIEHRGPALAQRIADAIEAHEGVRVPVLALDVRPWRDDLGGAFDPDAAGVIPDPALRPFDLASTTVVLVDDVLYTGRTIRAALDALIDFGRPQSIQLVVLVDRGHRELPIKADYVGKNLPTSRQQSIQVRLEETDGLDEVSIEP
jgi:pyrimidine operon attenuation protein/uracil phosphoribosyltransferase